MNTATSQPGQPVQGTGDTNPKLISNCCEAETGKYLLYTYCTECGEYCQSVEPRQLAF